MDAWEAGFAPLPSLLSPSEVANVVGLLEPVLAAPLAPGCERPNNTLRPLRWSDPVVELFLRLPARVARIAEAAGARDLRWISGYVSTKDPRSPPLWWHQDWWCWAHPISFEPDPVQVAVLVYLTHVDESNGALRVLAGTHWESRDLHAQLPEAHSRLAGEADIANPSLASQPDQITLRVRPGDAVVTDYRLLHGTHANSSDEPRHALIMSFTPNWGGLPNEVRGHLIQHSALPSTNELEGLPSWFAPLAPEHSEERVSLDLSRAAPASFHVRRSGPRS